MGSAKRRRAEIAQLKQLSAIDPTLQGQERTDEERLSRGIDPEANDPELTAAMTRRLAALLERAKRERNIDAPVRFLYAKLEATLHGLREISVACKRGCSHCCHTGISASAPEVLFIAKSVKLRGTHVVERVKAANEVTKNYDFDTRLRNPQPCPLLEKDLCSIYDFRPRSCRLAASVDANICERSFRSFSNEGIPTPRMHMTSRNTYSMATALALKHAGLSPDSYEFNAALTCALARDDAEQAWLAGEDIFRDVMRDPANMLTAPPGRKMYLLAFGREP